MMPIVADQPPMTSGPVSPNPEPRSPSRLRVALVNNMPDAARQETAAHLLGLVEAGRGSIPVDIDQYRLTGPDLDHLEARAPDVLIVTGTEPTTDVFPAEPYWEDMVRLLRWAPTATTSVLLCCLAAHASLLLVDGLARNRLPTKCHGVFPNRVAPDHVLTAGIRTPVHFPHSRLNDVPAAALRSVGWEMGVWSDDIGWTIASRLDGGCRVVLAQGHPEYGGDTLLREYRRDVRRFVNGERPAYPSVPVGYLEPAAVAVLTSYREIVQGGGRPSVDFPFDAAAAGIIDTWRPPAERLFTNLLGDAVRRIPSPQETQRA